MTFSYLQSAVANHVAVSHTFSAQNLGAADSERRIIVAVTFGAVLNGAGRSFSSISVGGVAATIKVQELLVAQGQSTAIAVAAVPSGTSGDVVVTLTSAPDTYGRWGLALYRLVGVPLSEATDTGGGPAPAVSVDLNVPANGMAVAVLCVPEQGATSITWTDDIAGEPTEDYDETTVPDARHSGAQRALTSADTAYTMTATRTDSSGSMSISGYTFAVAEVATGGSFFLAF